MAGTDSVQRTQQAQATNAAPKLDYSGSILRLNLEQAKITQLGNLLNGKNARVDFEISRDSEMIGSLLAKAENGSLDVNVMNSQITFIDNDIAQLKQYADQQNQTTNQQGNTSQNQTQSQGGGSQGNYSLDNLRQHGTVGKLLADGIGLVKDVLEPIGKLFKGIFGSSES